VYEWGVFIGSCILAWVILALFLVTGRLVYTPFKSLPKGFYWRMSTTPAGQRGEVVVINSPDNWRPFLPANFPTTHVMKQVVGVVGDVVCWTDDAMLVTLYAHTPDSVTTTYPYHHAIDWRWGSGGFCVTLRSHELVLVGTHERSMDSRYLGPVQYSAILYQVTPLLTWGAK
jgi:type IV secretory pathway protease TraF